VLASCTQVRGLKPGRSRRIFKGGKILSTSSFGRKVKPWVPCRRFAACKRSLNVPWKSAFWQNYRSLFPAHKFQLPPLECGKRLWARGYLLAKAGASKAGGTINQQAALHLRLAADTHGNKQRQTHQPTLPWMDLVRGTVIKHCHHI
jgi:hypothetical protein